MKARALERLVETLLLSDLEKAEQALIEGKELDLDLPGINPGEDLAYLTAARWIVQKINSEGCEFRTAYEAYLDEMKEQ